MNLNDYLKKQPIRNTNECNNITIVGEIASDYDENLFRVYICQNNKNYYLLINKKDIFDDNQICEMSKSESEYYGFFENKAFKVSVRRGTYINIVNINSFPIDILSQVGEHGGDDDPGIPNPPVDPIPLPHPELPHVPRRRQ